jgi:hypothetical protein
MTIFHSLRKQTKADAPFAGKAILGELAKNSALNPLKLLFPNGAF